MSTLRFIALTQFFIILILVLMVFGLLYWSWRLNHNVSYYYAYAEPYIKQAMDHGLSVFAHADNSSAVLEHIMDKTGAMISTSMPTMAEAVNRSLRIVSRLEHMTYNPTIKMSLA